MPTDHVPLPHLRRSGAPPGSVTPPPPRAAVPMHRRTFRDVFPRIQPERPLAQLEAITPCPAAVTWGQRHPLADRTESSETFCIYCEFCQAAAHLHVITSHCALGKQPIFTTNLCFHHVLHVFCYLKQFSITFSSSGFLPSLHFLPISLFSVPLYQLSVLVSSRTLIFQGVSFYWNCDNYQ